jgi:hypothetical protein
MKPTNKMELRDLLIRAQQLVTFEEWYSANKTAYALSTNTRNPYTDYEEYVREIEEDFIKIFVSGR